MSVCGDFSAILIGISGECDHVPAAADLRCNSTTKWPNFPLHHFPVITTTLAASISEIPFTLPLVKLPFIIHCISCFPQTNSPKEENKPAKQKESGYDK